MNENILLLQALRSNSPEDIAAALEHLSRDIPGLAYDVGMALLALNPSKVIEGPDPWDSETALPDCGSVGNTVNYDRSLDREGRVFKLGRDGTIAREGGDGYPGGWVWKSSDEASAFIFETEMPFEASVYELELPNGWEKDVNPVPGADGVHNLINDAVIVRKV